MDIDGTQQNLFSWRHAILSSDLGATTRHVLLTLSCHMSDAGDSCFPSTKTLSKETGLSERAVITHIHKAKAMGWLKVGLHGFGGQRWKSHDYTVGVPKGTEPRSNKGAEPSSVAQEKALNLVHKGTEPNDEKALNEVQSNSTDNSTSNSTLGDPGESPSGRKRDYLWEAVMSACGLEGVEPTKAERGAWNRAVKELREIGVLPNQVGLRAQAYRNRWPGASLTPSALARRWNEAAVKPNQTNGASVWDGAR